MATPSPKLMGGIRPTAAAGLNTLSNFGLSNIVQVNQGRMRNLLDMVRQIRDYNADASKAISNTLRLANSGWTATVYGMDGETPDPEGQKLIDALIGDDDRSNIALEYGGGLDVLIDQMHLTLATQGAVALEVELTPDTRDVADIITVNPWVIDFEQDPDTQRWTSGIRAFGSFIPLNTLQFKYIPLDPEPGDPRGRSPFWSALDIVFFQMEVLRDMKASTHFAGYPRVDISVVWESVYKVVQEMRPDLLEPGKADDLRGWLDAYLGDIETKINDLNPDDAFIHYDSVNSTYIVPTGRTFDVSQLFATIDTQIVSGLKQLPVLLGRNEGSTTTHATVQWQVYVRELESYQKITEHILSWALSLALRVWGRQGVVDVEFDGIRSSERLIDAQSEQLETNTKILQVQQGWITNDEAAQGLVGHDSVAAAQPTPAPTGRGLPDTRAAAGVEDVSKLPYWQQERYKVAEGATWTAYRDQIKRAWGRLDKSIRKDESRATVTGKNGHGHNDRP